MAATLPTRAGPTWRAPADLTPTRRSLAQRAPSNPVALAGQVKSTTPITPQATKLSSPPRIFQAISFEPDETACVPTSKQADEPGQRPGLIDGECQLGLIGAERPDRVDTGCGDPGTRCAPGERAAGLEVADLPDQRQHSGLPDPHAAAAPEVPVGLPADI